MRNRKPTLSTLTAVLFAVFAAFPATASPSADQALVAAIVNHPKTADDVMAALKAGANPNATTEHGIPVLFIAATLPDPSIAKALIDAGANVDAVGPLGDTPLILAAEDGYQPMLDLFLSRHADVDKRDRGNNRAVGGGGVTALWVAASQGSIVDIDILKKLIAAHANPNLASANGWTPLMAAAWSGSLETVRALLDDGADIKAKADSGYTALSVVPKGHPEIDKCLLDHGADPNCPAMNPGPGRDKPILEAASANNDPAVVLLLVEHGAKADADNGAPLIIAAANGYIEVVKLLVANGADVNRDTTGQGTPLVAAAGADHADVVACLYASGADVNKSTSDGRTPLIAAVQSGEQPMVNALLDHGAKIDAVSMLGTAFGMAVETRQIPMMQDLAARGADINAPVLGTTPLIYCAGQDDLGTTQALLDLHAVDNPGPKHETALMHAAAKGDAPILKLLLDHNDAVDAHDDSGRTALHYAVMAHQPDCVRALLDHHAAVDIADANGNTPLSIASRDKQKDIVSMLKKAGAK